MSGEGVGNTTALHSSLLRQAIEQSLSLATTVVTTKLRPYVTLSYAQALDGSIAAHDGGRLQLSGDAALCLTHELRALNDAILVGIGTVMADDPRLTTRLVDGASPQPIIVDSRLRFPLTSQLLHGGQRRPWIVTREPVEQSARRRLQSAGAQVIVVAANERGGVGLPALLNHLATAGIERLMVEGGARIIASFLTERLVDQAVITIAPRWLAGLPAATTASAEVLGLVNVSYERFGDDLVVRGDVRGARQ